MTQERPMMAETRKRRKLNSDVTTEHRPQDLNDDCWMHILDYVGQTSLSKLLELSVLNRRFQLPVVTCSNCHNNRSEEEFRKINAHRQQIIEQVKQKYSISDDILQTLSDRHLTSSTWDSFDELMRSAAERERTVESDYADIKGDYRVKSWVLDGSRDINEIAETIRTKDQRKSRLVEALQKHRLTLRNDSRICEAYIERNEGVLEDVVRVMVEMHWFFNHTDYASLRWVYEDEDEYEGGCGYEYDHYDRYRGWGEPHRYVDSAVGKERAIEAWANKFYKKHRHLLTSIDDLPRYLSGSGCLPPSLHEDVLEALKRR
ncbi:hypothetical protein HDU85_005081 [Gaertneriomyces sp. JEL0708]|nr:hypothetical protein HDU85_005081 [Gaertneriomyces sp. JEL0708]